MQGCRIGVFVVRTGFCGIVEFSSTSLLLFLGPEIRLFAQHLTRSRRTDPNRKPPEKTTQPSKSSAEVHKLLQSPFRTCKTFEKSHGTAHECQLKLKSSSQKAHAKIHSNAPLELERPLLMTPYLSHPQPPYLSLISSERRDHQRRSPALGRFRLGP